MGTARQQPDGEIVHALFDRALANQHLPALHQKALAPVSARFRDRLLAAAGFDGDAPRPLPDPNGGAGGSADTRSIACCSLPPVLFGPASTHRRQQSTAGATARPLLLCCCAWLE